MLTVRTSSDVDALIFTLLPPPSRFPSQIMNVEGLTRENVASHLQKYRLQLSKSKPAPAKEPAARATRAAAAAATAAAEQAAREEEGGSDDE